MPEISVGESIRTWFGRTFQAREVFLRNDGRVRYFTISGRVQLLAAASLAVLSLWAFVSAGGLLLRGAQLEEKNILLDETLASNQSLLGERERYQALIDEVERDYRQYSAIVQELESNQLILLNLLAQEADEKGNDYSQSPSLAGEGDDAPLIAGDATDQLAPKMDVLRQQLADVAARGSVLESRASEITTALTLTQSERLELENARDALALRLQNLRADFDNSQAAREADREHITGLKTEVASLLTEIGRLEDERDDLTVSLAERTLEIATWQDQNSQLEQALRGQAESLSMAEKRNKVLSAGWSLKYADLSAERDVLGQQISGLNNHISQLGEQNMDAVIRLRRTAELAVDSLEKTIEATGLSPDNLLTIAGLAIHKEAKPQNVADIRLPAERRSVPFRRALGRGGPYVGYESEAYSEPHSELADALDLLDTKLERWKVLQELMRAIPLSAPLEEFEITSYYGKRRDPLNGRKARHLGMDFSGDKRASVYATAPGRVTRAGWYGQFGKFVEIEHGFGIKTRYAHLNDVIVKRGDRVTSRQKVGTVGTTGRSTGPHVHYEILFNGTSMNPAKFLTAGNNVFKE